MMRTTLISTTVALALGLAPSADAAGTRTHVSNSGSDANTAFSCDYAHPCRTFAAALGQTTAGGEILAIDSSGYGKLVIDRSVSIVAAPGVFAGIGVGAGGNGTGVEIATAGVDVVLRGLTITGQGGSFGVRMTAGNSLSIENGQIAGFTDSGVSVATSARVSIVDSLMRWNGTAAAFSAGAAALVSDSRFLNNANGVAVLASTALTTSRVTVERCVASGNGEFGYYAQATNAISIAHLTITDSVASDNNNGIFAFAPVGAAQVHVSNSQVSGNQYGLAANQAGARLIATGNTVTRNALGLYQANGSTFRSDGTNSVQNNTTDATGVISPFVRI